MQETLRSSGILVVGLLLGAACAVSLPESAQFSCATDVDCNGDGLVCAPSGICCIPEPERCDGEDNDCDGVVDEEPVDLGECSTRPESESRVGVCGPGFESCVGGVKECEGESLPRAELCNNLDDDCDGVVDETFDFQNDSNNCGGCAAKCLPGKKCVQGMCPLTNEARCGDGVDDDQDGRVDCADADCSHKACGAGCTCGAGAKKETGCSGGVDDDGDGNTDCADSDCGSQLCQPGPMTYLCTGGSCTCNGGTPAQESRTAGARSCWDNVDNDCDGAKDCAEDDCEGVLCPTGSGAADGGCICAAGKRKELDCSDLNGALPVDNDGDGVGNCADVVDCPALTPCRYRQGLSTLRGWCTPVGTCSNVCPAGATCPPT